MTKENSSNHHNIVLLRGACLWLLMALILAWSMIAIYFNIPPFPAIFKGEFSRLLQAHLDFLLMTALILGIYAASVPLPWSVRWAIVVGAFTNSSLFLLQAMFPILDNPEIQPPLIFNLYRFSSLLITSYGFGKASVIVLKSTFNQQKHFKATEMKAWIRLHYESALLLVALLLLVAATFNPTTKIVRDVKSYMILIDVTQSMNVKDMKVDGQAVSRLDFTKDLIKKTLKALPCQSRVGLGIFFKADVAFLYNPLETCTHLTTLWATLDHLEWRMASRGNSNIRLGLQSIATRMLTAESPINVVFITNGDEAPPLNAITKTKLTGWQHGADWLLVGVGGTKPSPIPKLDANNQTKGYWSVYSVKIAPGAAVNDGPNSARDESYATAPYEYYLSKLDEGYMQELANGINGNYLRASSPKALAQAMQKQQNSYQDDTDFSLGRLLALGAMCCLLALYCTE